MSTISPQQQQYYKELVTPFQPMGRLLVGTDLRGTRCDRFGNGELRLVGYGDSSGGYAFSPSNQDAAIAPSFNSANLSNIANSLPQLTEVQDNAGKWIDSITLHALDEFIEQTEPQSFIPNTLRIFSGGQKGFRGEGTGNRNVRNTYILIAEIPIPALTRADIPRSFTVSVGAYIPPSENIYLGLAIPQPYTVSFELWDLQANTQVGSGASSSIGGSSSVGNGNDLSDSLSNTPVDTQFVLPLTFASATWVLGTQGGFGSPNVPPPSTTPPPTPAPPLTSGAFSSSSSSPSEDNDNSQPSTISFGTPSASDSNKSTPQNPPSSAGCTPIQDCQWRKVSVPSNVGKVQVNTGDYTGLCPKGTVSRGIIEFETSGTFVLCCGPATFPPNNLGCTSLMKWSCVSGGTCVEDVNGIYNSQAECQAALIPPSFTGGQCRNVVYRVWMVWDGKMCPSGETGTVYGQTEAGRMTFNTPPTDALIREAGIRIVGTQQSVRFVSYFGEFAIWVIRYLDVNNVFQELQFTSGVNAAEVSSCLGGFQVFGQSARIFKVLREDGLPDNCGNPPSTCP